MKNYSLVSIALALCVSCSENRQNTPAPPAAPVKAEASTTEQLYRTENVGDLTNIYLGDKLIIAVKKGTILSESPRFVAYKVGDTAALLGKDGSTVYSCTTICFIKVSNAFAIVQTAPGKGVIFAADSKRIYSSNSDGYAVYRLSNTFASVSRESGGKLFRVGSEDPINGCTDVACDILVSENFASVVDTERSTGSVIGSDGKTVYTFYVPGKVQISSFFAAVTHANSAVLYHAHKGRIYSASTPVTIIIEDFLAAVFDGGKNTFFFDQKGDSL